MAAELVGFRKGEAVGEPLRTLFDRKTPGQLGELIDAVKSTIDRNAANCDIAARTSDGSGREEYLNANVHPLHDERGKVSGAVMLVRNTNTEHALKFALKTECANLSRSAKEHEQTIKELHNYIEYAQIFGNSLTHILSLKELNNGMASVLATAGRAVRADRSYVFEYSDDGTSLSNICEWTAEGIASEKPFLQQVPADEWKRWTACFNQHRPVLINDTDDPALEERERLFLKRQNIRSLIAYGIFSDNRLSGFVGLDFVRSERKFSYLDEQIMRDISNLLVCVRERNLSLELRKKFLEESRLKAQNQDSANTREA